MKRRNFLKGLTLAAAGTLVPFHADATGKKTSTEAGQAANPNFTFNKEGKFKILQFTDTHFITGDARAERALANVREMVEIEKPDLVIHTGDIIYGKPAKESLRELLSVFSSRGIPFAVTLGNHDEEFGMTRREVYDYVRSLPHNVNTPPKNMHGMSNDLITISSGGRVKWALYLLDTGNQSTDIKLGTYDYLHFDQISWYREQSQRLREANGGVPVPALAFSHIPVYEHFQALDDRKKKLTGNWGEAPCPSTINSGFFAQTQEMADVRALISGHDHDNDYVMKWREKYLIYGRYSGGDTVYNNLKPNGCRLFELTDGSDSFRTWIRVSGGGIEQELLLPEDL